jgi:hypothetical protein
LQKNRCALDINDLGSDKAIFVSLGETEIHETALTCGLNRYIYLLERAIVVHKSLGLKAWWLIYFRKVVALAIILGIPAAFGWSFFLIFDGRVLYPEGCCVQVTSDQTPMLAFALCDIALSGCMLFLFAYPLRKHIKVINAMQVAEEKGRFDSSQGLSGMQKHNRIVLRVITRNLLLSSMIM